MFWNTKTEEHNVKYVKKLLDIKACAENWCSRRAPTIIPSSPGPVQRDRLALDSKYIDVSPTFLCITAHHVCAASADFVYVWQYRTLMSKLTSVDTGTSSPPQGGAGALLSH